jgi:hypothetical protein
MTKSSDDWIAKVFTVTGIEDSRRTMGVTITREARSWEASDPRGMISPDEGRPYREAARITAFFASEVRIFRFYDCIPDTVGETDTGNGEIDASEESIEWTCDRIIRE